MSGPFATATEFCSSTGLAMPSDLARLQGLLDDASAEVRGYTGQVLSVVTGDTFTSVPWSSALIVLPERPVTGVASVVVDAVTVAAGDYEWSRGGQLWRLDGAAWEAATVTYTHGYAETSDDFHRIKMICIGCAARAFAPQEQAASQILGATILEAVGYAPEIFLTSGEQDRLSVYGATVMA